MSGGSTFPWLEENDTFRFPTPDSGSPEGVVAMGGNLSPGMLLSAYRQGIFPWFDQGDPILWWSPDPRFVLELDRLHVSRSMRRVLRTRGFTFTFDRAFVQVVRRCAASYRARQRGTWITTEMIDGYVRLHHLGYAHSCETWDGDRLVGGLYGVSLGRAFFGESMFTLESNASKAALVVLVQSLKRLDFRLLDSQVHTTHIESMGGHEIPRSEYLRRLDEALAEETIRGSWAEALKAPEWSDQ
jgi:leucyl/phenylalanyl-tRNA--protein transferase